MARYQRSSPLAEFAVGFGQGYLKGKELERKQKMEDQKFALEQERNQLENRRLGIMADREEADKVMRDELKQISTDVKPIEAYKLVTPQGSTVYADSAQAQAAMAELGNAEGVSLSPVHLVGARQFDDPTAAQQVADQLNSPAVRNRRSAEVAMKYGNPQLAQQFSSAYKTQMDMNRAEMRDMFMQARATGDLNMAADLYSRQFARGGQVQLVQGQDGQIVANRIQNGQVVSSTPMGSPAEFWDQADRMTMATPDNALEMWKADKEFGLRGRQVASQEKATDAQVRRSDAEVANIPFENSIKRMQAGAAMTSAGAAASNAQTARMNLMQPKISAVPDDKGNLNYIQTPQTYDSRTGQWGLGAPQIQAAPGMRYPAIATQEARSSMNSLGALMPQQQQIDWNAVGNALGNLPAKNIGGAPAPAAAPATAPRQSTMGMGAATQTAPQAPLTPDQQRYLQWVQQQNGR